MSNISGLIFDMDGVIVHSNPVHKEVINDFLKKHNRKEITEDFLREKVYGRTNQEWIPHVIGDISNEEIEEFADEKESMFRSVFDPQKAEVKGVKEFIQEARNRNLKTALATSAPKKNADYIIKKLDLSSRFDKIIHSLHIHRSKPDPEIYLQASKMLNLDPGACLVFEDSLSGVESARKAGTKVIGVTTTHTKDELKNCDLVIDDFTGLKLDDVLDL